VVGEADRTVGELADGAYSAGLLHVLNWEYGNAVPAFESAGAYVRYPLAFIDKRREFREGGRPPEEVLFDRPVLTEDAEIFLRYQSMNRAIGYFVESAELGNRYAGSPGTESGSVEDWRQGRISSAEAMERERVFRGNSGGFLTEIDALLAGVDGERTELRNYQDNFEGSADRQLDVLVYINNVDSVIRNLQARVFDREIEAAVRFYTIANGELERRITARKAEYDEGNRLIQGTPRDESGGGPGIDHYPAEGLAVLTRMEEEAAADMRMGTGLLDQYAGERGEVFTSGTVSALRVSARAMVDELGDLRARGQTAAAGARTQIAQADAFRLDGDRFFREARNALTQNSFDIARDRVQRATERYNSSLAIQESASLRVEWDTRLVNLGEEINRIENEIVIRDVRSLVNTARNSYFSGNFEQAEDLLVRAQNRWKRTNVGDDGEVLYWLNVVRGALTLRSGRVIPPTAPLYAEMSQLLSDAKKNYEEGVRHLNANQRTAGIAKFTEARQKTQEVKLMFPVNQEARLLELRMEQVTDPAAFSASFDLRFAEAVAGTKRQSPEAFTDLQNLAEINPRYPGLAAALIQAEIDMGYRLPPPNPRDLARSNELTAAARRIIDGNITTQFEVALRQVEEALALNPNNSQAMTAKDQIQTRMSGTGTVVLDSRSEALYGQAVSEFQRGNFLIASAIMEQLLQDPKNRSSTRILELQRRIQSRL
jgi:tetratricopeptide (TPR) repeat protein